MVSLDLSSFPRPWRLSVQTPAGPRKSAIPVVRQTPAFEFRKRAILTRRGRDTSPGKSDEVLAFPELVYEGLRFLFDGVLALTMFLPRNFGCSVRHIAVSAVGYNIKVSIRVAGG